MFVQIFFLILSLSLTLLFFLYGLNLYYLLCAAAQYRNPVVATSSDEKPRVAIHLPIYNEKYVIPRVMAACADIARAYGTDRVRILVLDDSDDDTASEIDARVSEYLGRGIQVEAVRRSGRQGFKAGALQLALDRTDEEFIAVFDADFMPSPDFLNRTVPFLVQDKQLGAVQSRWSHINRDYNFVTRAIAIGIDVHFFIEQPGRWAAGCFLNFNGSGGVFRRSALVEAGGWQADTLAEDLDVSYRIQPRGYGILYLRDVQSPGEIPPTVPIFKKQQARWACGSLRAAKKILPELVADRRLNVKERFEAFIHLTNYMVHPLMLASFLLACLAALWGVDTIGIARTVLPFPFAEKGNTAEGATLVLHNLTWILLGSLILLSTLSAWIHPVVALRAQGLKASSHVSSLLILFLLGCGISLNNTIEAGKALLTNRDWAFRRTPKYAIRPGRGEWRNKAYQVPLDPVWYLEVALAVLGGIAMGIATWRQDLGALPILAPYTAAYAFVVWHTMRQTMEGRRG